MDAPALDEWTSNPTVRYLAARDLAATPPRTLARLRRERLDWPPLRRLLVLQRSDGGFPSLERSPTANPTGFALRLMDRPSGFLTVQWRRTKRRLGL